MPRKFSVTPKGSKTPDISFSDGDMTLSCVVTLQWRQCILPKLLYRFMW